MARIERIREDVTGPLDLENIKQKTEAGWRLIALEWQREIAGEQPRQLTPEIPYGLRISDDCMRLEENPGEKEILMNMMELLIEDRPFSQVANELNRRAFRTRNGAPWTPVSVFNMLPRLIEAGPSMFSSDEWESRRAHLVRER